MILLISLQNYYNNRNHILELTTVIIFGIVSKIPTTGKLLFMDLDVVVVINLLPYQSVFSKLINH